MSCCWSYLVVAVLLCTSSHTDGCFGGISSYVDATDLVVLPAAIASRSWTPRQLPHQWAPMHATGPPGFAFAGPVLNLHKGLKTLFSCVALPELFLAQPTQLVFFSARRSPRFSGFWCVVTNIGKRYSRSSLHNRSLFPLTTEIIASRSIISEPSCPFPSTHACLPPPVHRSIFRALRTRRSPLSSSRGARATCSPPRW